jgi:hypothetical protein
MTNTLFTVSGAILARNVTREEAITICTFARRPVLWGSELIGGEYAI